MEHVQHKKIRASVNPNHRIAISSVYTDTWKIESKCYPTQIHSSKSNYSQHQFSAETSWVNNGNGLHSLGSFKRWLHIFWCVSVTDTELCRVILLGPFNVQSWGKIKTSPVLDINGKMNHQNKCDDCPQGLVATLMRNPFKALFSKDTESQWFVGENETDPPHCALVL